ncbi:DUF2142 domain-containing protein [Paenibacillus elgii]|uniref:DUF2142 domain-containing protein n=1 Tax=Paenibacillus elgii TaxID=189691 RepID=UPI00203EAE3C|nr:DUF2142 domain-containing protein [Paenibacillus elgii]MCM3272398.1 DUF2142 domain-containing protein [Paenibacillus elgii]
MLEANNIKIEKIFLKLALIFGLMYVFITPPYQVADEDSHFKKAFLTQQFIFFPEIQDGKIGNFVPKAILDFENNNRYMIGKTNAKYSYDQFYSDFSAAEDLNDKQFVSFSTTKTNPVLYFPQAVLMFFTTIFSKIISFGSNKFLNPATYMYAGRIGNLIFYIICGYFSLRLIPFYKRLLLLLLLMPMSITLASSLSYDGMVISITVFFVSIVLHYAYSEKIEKISKKEIFMLLVLSILLVELKQVYFPLIFLFFLIPMSKFSSKKKYFTNFLVIFFIGVFTHLLWMFLLQLSISAQEESNSLGLQQMMFILHHPMDYFLILIRTFREYDFYYLNSFIGNLGWLDTNFPYNFILFYALFLILLAIVDTNQEVIISFRRKILVALLFAVIIFLIETSLYITWTSIPQIGGIGHKVVSGVQGRYFIPCSLLLLLLLYKNNISKFEIIKKIKEVIFRNISLICTFSCSFTLLIIVIRYWI